MKKTLLIMAACVVSIAMFATDLTGKRIYVNPGHGSWGPNDRPNATIPYPNLASTGMPDTCGFYETNTNLWKCLELRDRLEAAGAFVMMSHTQGGPWPYEKVDGEYPDYTYEHYKNLPDYEKYNRPLLEIADEAEANNMDYFISVHSNAATDGNTVNYLAYFYRGNNAGEHVVPGAIDMCKASWYHAFECRSMDGLEPNNYDTRDPETSKHILADIDFYHSSYDATLPSSGKTYTGYLGVLHHGVPGFLVEGYFHTYQPARHRALNPDYCKQEGIRYYRGIVDYFKAEPETKGYILGTVKDEHNAFVHELYKYAPNTNDQYAPLNGAVVTLSKENGEVVGTYTVDNNYNGLFYFPDLEPGTYKLDAVADGYKPLHRQYQTVVVEANATSYPFLYLEDTAYVDLSNLYVDYPDPEQPAYAALPTQFNMKQNELKDNTAKIKGTIKRTIQHADSVFYLTHEEDGTAHIYVLNNTTGKLDTISTVGIVPVDPTNPGDHLALSDIAITCDGKLVGINYTRCNYDDSAVESGYKRGTTRFYIWDDFYADPVEWFTSLHSSNSLKSDQGYTFALRGMSDNCNIIATGVHRYGNGARFTLYNVVNGMLASETYFGDKLGSGLGADELAEFEEAEDGVDFQLTLSPRGDKINYIMDAEKMAPVEFEVPETTTGNPIVQGGINPELIGVKFQGASYFMYAGRSMMVTPFQNEEGFVAGIKLFDITDGMDKAVEVKLDYGFFEPYGAPTTHASAGAYVDGAVLNLYLYVDGLVWSFTTVGVQQPIVERMNALNLKVAKTEFDYIFSFVANQDAPYAAILFYDENKEVVEQIDIEAAKGENQVRVAVDMLPSEAKTWGITLTGTPVPGMGLVADHADSTMLKPYAIVNSHPLTDQFGQLYVMEGKGDNMGVSIYDINMNKLNTTPYVSADGAWDAPKRLAIASDGTLFIAEFSDAHSGVYVMDPAQPENITQFFTGTRDGNGVISNGGVNVGASTAGISIYKEGAESKLIVYNEDFGSSLGNILIYNIGQEDGSIVKTWEAAPSEVYGKGSNLAGLVNKNGQPILTDYGFFCSTLRYAGGNNSYATSIRYYNFAQECEFSTHYDAFAPYVNGSNDGALALSNDQKYLVLPDDNNQFIVFECAWDSLGKLSVKYVESFVHNLGPVHQLSFDYAGNLIASAAGHIARYTMPTADNTIVIPAKTALADATEVDPGTGVENVEASTLDCNAPMYDVLGRQVDKNYHGIVIQNGHVFLITK
jgi:N-acetylmuramoyl-L-alanine amidase